MLAFLGFVVGVLLVGGATGTASAEQQEELVRGVGQGVHALGQHRRGPADRGRDELHDCDADVRTECGEDRLRASRSAHSCPLLPIWKTILGEAGR